MALAPTDLKLAATASTLVASWQASATAGLGGWKVNWRKVGTLGWPGAQSAVLSAATLQFRITGLEQGSAYEVQVRALAGEGAATATGKTEAPEVPSGSGSGVASSPAGVPGSWHPEFADEFAVPFGTAPGENNCWYPNRGGTNPADLRPGDNANELQVYSSSQVSQDAEGLRLRLLHSANAGGTGKDYIGGTIRGVNGANPAGYRLFKWKPTAGQAFALEIVWKLPPNTREMDPGFWSTDSAWTAELDHPEMWGWPTAITAPAYSYEMGCPVWIYRTPTSSVHHESYDATKDLGFDPTAGFHRWCTVLNADGTLDFYADGVHKWHVSGAGEPNRPWMGVIVQNALRRPSSASYTTSPNFPTGFRDLQARSVAVYTDAAHAGQNVQNGGVAPGSRLV